MSDSIAIDRKKLLAALRDLEVIVPSLDRIGSASIHMSRSEYCRTLTDFIDQWDVFRRLARVRKILSEGIPDDELEELLEDVPAWTEQDKAPL